MRLAGHHQAVGLQPVAIDAHAEPAPVRSTVSARALPHFGFAADRRRHRVHHLPESALQRAEQRRRRPSAISRLGARGQHAARQAAVLVGQFDEARQHAA